MSFTTAITRLSYNGDGTSVNFPVPWLFYANTDLLVILGGVTQSLGVQFNASGAGLGSGTVSFVTPPLIGVGNIQIILNDPLIQTANFVDGTAFPSGTLNQVNDRAVQISSRLYDLITRSLRAPDGDVNSAMLLPVASSRAGGALIFDANGNPIIGVPVTGTITTALLAPFLNLQQTPAETAASVTPVALQYPTLNPLRYGAVGDGVTDDHVAVQAAFTVAGKAGGTVIFPPGYTFLCNSDIIVPVAATVGGDLACAQGPGWATISVIFGSGSNFGFVFLGTGATTGDVTSSAYNYAGTFRDLGITLTGTASHAFYLNSVNQPRLEKCWIRGSGTNSSGAYFLNCLLPIFNDCLVTGCGSASQGSVEFDACTTAQWNGSRISGGVTTVGGLCVDRCTNFIGRGMSIESCGIPIRIGHKAEATLAVNGFDLSGLELENPGSTTYIDIGAGLSGGALVLNGRITAWRGAPAPTATVAFGIRVQNCSGLDIGSSLVTQGAAPTSFLEIVGTNVSGIVVRANRLLQSNAYPWVRYNGTQVKHAGCQMDWQLGVTNGGVPVCTVRGLDQMQVSAQTGATPNPSLGAAGGFMRSFQLSQGGATNVTSMAIQETGAEVYVYHADGNSTYVFGAGAGQFITKTGINITPAGGTFVGWKSNGTAWSQIA